MKITESERGCRLEAGPCVKDGIDHASSEGIGGESRSGLSGHINLSVISTTVKVDAVVLKDIVRR